jgi:hypothetical protein
MRLAGSVCSKACLPLPGVVLNYSMRGLQVKQANVTENFDAGKVHQWESSLASHEKGYA